MMSKLFLTTLLAFAAVGAVADTCDPLNTRCPPNIGLANSTYTIDFTQQTTVPPDWTLSNYASLNFSSKGAEFTVAKRFDSPQLWSNFFVHYGRVEVVAQVASGIGIVSSAVLLSDDLDEIDLEFSGNNFGDTVSKGQNNYYGKGITGDYDRASFFNVASPQTQFHTYTVDWTSTALTWSVDGTIVRTLYAANADNGTHQYPQTPAKFQLGVWAAGDYGNAWGTVSWAGGYTDYTQAPFTMYVKSVQITNYNPAYAYNYTDNSGSSGSIKYLSAPAVSSPSTTITPTSSTGTQTKTFTYVGNSNGNGSGICYLKSASGTFSSAPNNYISGVLSANNSSASNTSSGSMTSSSATVISSSSVLPLASPSAILCPDAATQSFITSQNGSLYFMRCSSDTNIGSYSNSKASTSWKDCMNSCDSDSKCVAFTYVGGNGGIGSGQCWYKDALGSAVVAGPNYVAGFLAVKAQSSGASGSSIATSNLAVSSGSPTASSSTSSTSTASTSWAINSAGSNYTLFKNSDTNYGAYANVPATNSFMDCTTACDKDPKCTAWTYVGGSSGQGSGICWLKSQLGQPVPSNSNVISGSRLTQSVRMRRAVSSWWNSITSVKPTATETATTIPKPPPQPAWARYYHGGRWMWNGHGDWDWAWN
ncbi:concanavalin A-like lectin/glucanase, partial [Aureobasidium melanogenum]